MEKGLEFFDAWLKSQNEFLTQWTESIKKLQEAFLNISGSQDIGRSQEGPREGDVQ